MKKRDRQKVEPKRRVTVLLPPIADTWLITCRELAERGRLPVDPGLWANIVAGMMLYVQANEGGLDMAAGDEEPKPTAFYRSMVEDFCLPHGITVDEIDAFDLWVNGVGRRRITMLRLKTSWRKGVATATRRS